MSVRVHNRQLVIDGKPVPLLSGEIHYWRLDPRHWRTCLQAAKSAGLSMVATYVPWQIHEPEPGHFDFGEERQSSPLDLTEFLELCDEEGLYVFLRPGPLIVSEMKHGGLPEWLFRDPSMLTHNAQGEVARFGAFADLGNPCYLHPKYLEYVRAWLTRVNDMARPFFHTHGGPIVLVQLDNEVSMICLDSFFASEYNPIVTAPDGLYHQWLRRRYGSLDAVPYRDKPDVLTAIDPPRSLPQQMEDNLAYYFDWVDFKEDYMADYVRALAAIHRADGLKEELFAVNFNPHRPLDVPNNWYKIEQATGGGITGFDYYKRPHLRWIDFQKTVLSARYSCAVTKLPWSPEWMCGIWGEDFGGDGVVGPEHTEFLCLVGLAYGLVGFNHYMFCERESWAFSAINEYGQRRYNHQAITTMSRIIRQLDPPSLRIDSRVGLLYDRHYAWLAHIEEKFACQDDQVSVGTRTVDGTRNGETAREVEGLFSLLLQLGHVPTLLAPGVNIAQAEGLEVVVVPCQERMAPHVFLWLCTLAEKGVRLVFDPAPPHLDWNGRPLGVSVPPGANIVSLGCRIAQGKIGEEDETQRQTLRDALGNVGLPVSSGFPDLPITFARRGKERFLFLMNLHFRSREIEIALPQPCRRLEDLKTGERISVTEGRARLAVDCKQGRILRLQ